MWKKLSIFCFLRTTRPQVVPKRVRSEEWECRTLIRTRLRIPLRPRPVRGVTIPISEWPQFLRITMKRPCYWAATTNFSNFDGIVECQLFLIVWCEKNDVFMGKKCNCITCLFVCRVICESKICIFFFFNWGRNFIWESFTRRIQRVFVKKKKLNEFDG